MPRGHPWDPRPAAPATDAVRGESGGTLDQQVAAYRTMLTEAVFFRGTSEALERELLRTKGKLMAAVQAIDDVLQDLARKKAERTRAREVERR